MIAICNAPKRFVAALSKSRYGSAAFPNRRFHCLSVVSLASTSQDTTACHRNTAPIYRPKAVLSTTAYCNSTFIKSSTLNISLKQFSTKANEKERIHLREGGRIVSLEFSKLQHTALDTDGAVEQQHAVSCLNLHGARDENWWTGKAPDFGLCPGVEADKRIYSLPQLSFEAGKCTRQQLQDYFDNTWTLTEVLFSALQGEEAFTRSPYHNLRHPMIFYYGHPAALYVNKLRVAGLMEEPINPYFEVIFETGVDEMSWDDLSKNEMEWPSVAEVHRYRKLVYHKVSELIQTGLTDAAIANISHESPLWSLVMGFEHERIHLETSSVLMAEMPLEYLRFPEGFPAYHPGAVPITGDCNGNVTGTSVVSTAPVAGEHFPINEMISVPAQTVEVGKPRDFPTYGWDNEYGYRSFDIPAFAASKYMITNGEFLQFVKDGGYAKREYWTETGWEWRAFRNVKWPTMWVRKGPQGHHEYDLRLLFDVLPMAWALPVLVNFHEATAYANWKTATSVTDAREGKFRVLTELEHRAIRDTNEKQPVLRNDHAAVFGGAKMMQEAGYNTNVSAASMSPVDALAANDKGFHDLFGNAWEWTQDYFCALPGFQVHSHYEDFSTPCFDGQHHVIQGGSFISSGNESSVHARFHFRPHFFQHAGFRLAQQQQQAGVSGDVAEMVTTDLDAPGPYVGSYPFRRSQQALKAMMRKVADNSTSGGGWFPEGGKLSRNSLLLKSFGPAPAFTTTPTIATAAATTAGEQQAFVPVMHEFAQHIIRCCEVNAVNLDGANILEVGCGAGGLSFQLARNTSAASVIGTDHSIESTELARAVLAGKPVEYVLHGDGDLCESIAVPAADVVANSPSAMVDFRAADPMCLPAEFKDFDVVVVNDVIDTVASPNAVLGRLGGARGLVKTGGLLVVNSAFQWREETTPRSLWLGGYRDAKTGQLVSSQQALVERLAGEFQLVAQEQLPLVWYESQSALQGTVQSVSYFIRK